MSRHLEGAEIIKKILVVEDNETNMYLITFILKNKAYDVIEARSGEEGVETAKKEKPDLIIMDIQLPGIDGLETTKQIKGEVKAKEIVADDKIAKLSVVGIGMRSHSGIAEKMFKTLSDEKINIQMISTSEIKISCVIAEDQAEKALNAVHNAFELDKER